MANERTRNRRQGEAGGRRRPRLHELLCGHRSRAARVKSLRGLHPQAAAGPDRKLLLSDPLLGFALWPPENYLG